MASHDMLYCASIAFFSRSELGVICMTDDDFVRVVGDKERRKRRKEGRSKFVIGEKLIKLFLTNQRFYPIFGFPSQKFSFFRFSLSSHWPRSPPYAPWPKFDSDFHSENGPWHFVGRSRRPVPLPACNFGPPGAINSSVLMLGSKRNPP